MFATEKKLPMRIWWEKIKAKRLQSHFGLTIDVSVFGGTDGGLRLCSAPGPGIRDGQNSYSPAGQDR